MDKSDIIRYGLLLYFILTVVTFFINPYISVGIASIGGIGFFALVVSLYE